MIQTKLKTNEITLNNNICFPIGTIFAVQKLQEKELKKGTFKPFPILNRSDKILLLIDEAHQKNGKPYRKNTERRPMCLKL